MRPETTERPEAVVSIERPDGSRLERRYAADVAQAIASLFNDQTRLRGMDLTANVSDAND